MTQTGMPNTKIKSIGLITDRFDKLIWNSLRFYIILDKRAYNYLYYISRINQIAKNIGGIVLA